MYDIIADHYSQIFPLDPDRVKFVSSYTPEAEAGILDIGCATGDLSIALSKLGFTVTGIDLNETMITIAQTTAASVSNGPDFLTLDMNQITNMGRFHSLVCFGNTLPHLNTYPQVLEFFTKAHRILIPGGVLIVQILNYDKVLREGEKKFPITEHPEFTFKREYKGISPERIRFLITLEDKRSKLRFTDETFLLPITQARVADLFRDAGFQRVEKFTGYGKEPSNLEEMATLYVAHKKSES